MLRNKKHGVDFADDLPFGVPQYQPVSFCNHNNNVFSYLSEDTDHPTLDNP
jgi:hypothetical protein